MGSPHEDFDLLFEAIDPVSAEMAKGVLADAGIPCLIHEPDFDMAELGRAAHDSVRHPDVYVPKGTLERSQEVVRAAWGDDTKFASTP